MTDPRPCRLATTAFLGAVALVALPLAELPRRGTDLVDWWNTVGTADAAITLLRATAVAFCAYTTVVATLVAVASRLRRPTLHRLGITLALPALRSRLVAGTAVAVLAVPGTATAQDPPIVLTDRGSIDTTPASAPTSDHDPILLTELGPVVDEPVPTPAGDHDHDTTRDGFRPTPAAEPVPDSWLVEAGDHLWAIAEHMVRGADTEASESAVVRYWLRLIDLNRGTLGNNPDLIHPGQVLVLPAR